MAVRDTTAKGLTRMKLRWIAAVTIGACLAFGSAACGPGPGNPTQPDMTLDQAKDRVSRYLLEAFVELDRAVWPSTPKLTEPVQTSIGCDGLKDGSGEKVDLAVQYHLDYGTEVPDHSLILNNMYDFWKALGYQISMDTRAANWGRHIAFTNPVDNFTVGIIEDGHNVQLTLWASAPCGKEPGTPPPKK
jgi:hypothetical protein